MSCLLLKTRKFSECSSSISSHHSYRMTVGHKKTLVLIAGKSSSSFEAEKDSEEVEGL